MNEKTLINMSRKERTLIMQFQALHGIEEFKRMIGDSHILSNYYNEFPEIQEAQEVMERWWKYRRENPNESLVLFTYKKKSPAFKAFDEELKNIQKRLQPKAKSVVKLYQKLKKDGKIINPTPTPNVNSKHFKVANLTAKELSHLWFIDEVHLFGSVAAGREKEGSDIDLVYNIPVKGGRDVFGRICYPIERQLEKEYEIKLQILRKSKHMEDIDFFEPLLMLEKENIYHFSVGNIKRKIVKKGFSNYLIETYHNFVLQYLHISENEVLVIKDITPFMIISLSHFSTFAVYDIVEEVKEISSTLGYDDSTLKKVISHDLKKLLEKSKKNPVKKIFEREFYEQLEKWGKTEEYMSNTF